MNYTNLIGSCQAHLPMHFASNIELRSDTGIVIDSEPHLSRTCKTSLLCALLAVRIQAGYVAFPFTLRLTCIYDYILNTKMFQFLTIFFSSLDTYSQMLI